MAYQPKSYRRFLVTSVTAAMVAAAVAPNALAAVSTADATSVSFTDVTENTRHSEAILELAGQGIINGFPTGEFRPGADIKRGDAAVMIARSLGLITGEDVPASTFTDVKAGETLEAVAKLQALGVVSGFTETSFRPDAKLTRGQMAKMLVEAFDLEVAGDGSGTPFTDVATSVSTGKYIEAIYALEITSGKSATSYGTDLDIIRGDFAALLFRTMNLVDAGPIEPIEEVEVTDVTVEVEGFTVTVTGSVANLGDAELVVALDAEMSTVATVTEDTFTATFDEVPAGTYTLTFTVDGEEVEVTFADGVTSEVVVEEVEVVKEWTLVDLGAAAYRIDNNTDFGSWGVNLYLDQLPEEFAGATGFELVIGETKYSFTKNVFNANVYTVQVSANYTTADLEAALVVPTLPVEEDGEVEVTYDTLAELGATAYRIDNNTDFGSWGVNIYLDQLTADYAGKTAFALEINGEKFDFVKNPFNANILSVQIPSSFSQDAVKAGLVVAE